MASPRTLIYHFTCIDNLTDIVAHECILSKSSGQAKGITYTNVADAGIQDRRASKPVTVGVGGVLHDYVPFYFAPRSPMLFRISKGGVAGYNRGQDPLVYLVSTVEKVSEAALSFAFTDGNAAAGITRFFTDLADMKKIDWKLMDQQMWKNTTSDGDRQRRRGAEFLVHDRLPLAQVGAIVTRTQAAADQVTALLGGSANQPKVRVKADWYYP